jgi:hypothetical protein
MLSQIPELGEKYDEWVNLPGKFLMKFQTHYIIIRYLISRQTSEAVQTRLY